MPGESSQFFWFPEFWHITKGTGTNASALEGSECVMDFGFGVGIGWPIIFHGFYKVDSENWCLKPYTSGITWACHISTTRRDQVGMFQVQRCPQELGGQFWLFRGGSKPFETSTWLHIFVIFWGMNTHLPSATSSYLDVQQVSWAPTKTTVSGDASAAGIHVDALLRCRWETATTRRNETTSPGITD